MMLAAGDHIKRARRMRKMWGGGMRQIGLLAAAADYAVEHHYDLLKTDHERAKRFASAISENDAFIIDLDTVDTNIVLFDVAEGDAEPVLGYFTENGVGMVPFGPQTIRTTFHFQITDEEAERVNQLVHSYKT
jgi:threonine aldolase